MTRGVETPSFTFRLERVRSLRAKAEDAAREELARQLSLRLRGEALLAEAVHAANAARDAGLATATRPATGADLLSAQAFVERTERDRREAALALDRCDAEVEARRVALTDAARDREAIDRLKDRHRERHAREWARRGQNELDEIALAVHRRRAAA